MVNVAIIGVGYWGPNIARNIVALDRCRLTMICDQDTAQAESIRRRHAPDAAVVSDIADVLAAPDVDAVLLSTPIRSHFPIGLKVLEAGKHLFVEKPMAASVRECEILIEAAERRNLTLMVGHVFEFNEAVRWIKGFIDEGGLGKLFYIYGQRLNLGRVQSDVDSLWSFAPHDISIVNYWLGSKPQSVSANGFSFLTKGVRDVSFLSIGYPDNIGVNLHMSWLDPRKVRQITLVGSKTMLVYDDVNVDAKVMIYDKGISDLDDFLTTPESFAEFKFKLRTGDVRIPFIRFSEPLAAECRHFIECIESGKRPITDGVSGLNLLRVLEAADVSLARNGASIDNE
jgi:predicted dehydrogenase